MESAGGSARFIDAAPTWNLATSPGGFDSGSRAAFVTRIEVRNGA